MRGFQPRRPLRDRQLIQSPPQVNLLSLPAGARLGPYEILLRVRARGLGDADAAMDCLDRAYEQRSGALYGIKGSFLFENLRSHPRFKALLKKMNLA